MLGIHNSRMGNDDGGPLASRQTDNKASDVTQESNARRTTYAEYYITLCIQTLAGVHCVYSSQLLLYSGIIRIALQL